MKLVVVDSDATRRALLVDRLVQLGHTVDERAELSASDPSALGDPLVLGDPPAQEAPPSFDVAVLAGAELLAACSSIRRHRSARWIIGITPREGVAEALGAGANDCMCTGTGSGDSSLVDELELRLQVARAGGGLEPQLRSHGEDPLDNVLPRISGAQLRTILDSLPMPVGVVSSAGVFLQCNRELERTFRSQPGAIAGRKLTEFLANADAWEMFERVKTRGRVRDQQLEIVNRDGTSHWVAGQAQWIPGFGSDAEGCAIGTFIDLSERRQTEEALRQSEASLRSVLYATPDGIIVHSRGRYLFVNPAAVAQLGLAPDTDIVGQTIFEQLEPNEVLPIRERIDEMMRTGQPAPVRDIHFHRHDGELLVGEVASIPATFDGAPAIISIIRNVGEQRRIQSQLFLADRLATVGTLAVGVAHEINNPLSWVMGNLGLLADEFDNQVRMREAPGHNRSLVAASRARVRELLGRAQEGTERVRRIVRDLGRFARSDDGDRQAVDIHALLDSTLEIADVQIRHRARLMRDYRATGHVRGSEARLGQVFLNLLVNAGQAIDPGSPRQHRIVVTTMNLDDGRIQVSVSDTGCGMTERVRQRIFEPFYTTKPAGEGTGIGLAISHSIVAAAGGEILVESEPDRGTEFRVRLLRAEEDIPSRPAQAIREDSDPNRTATPVARILVVDDEPLIREMVCDALGTHEVRAVSNGRDALALILSEDWDLILCDMILPELSGLEVYAEVEKVRPEVLEKLVFMTGGDFSGKRPRLPGGGRVRRLEKPFSIKSLRALARDAARSA